jgi:hypothetical protein
MKALTIWVLSVERVVLESYGEAIQIYEPEKISQYFLKLSASLGES